MYRKGSYIAARIAGFIAVVLLGCIVAVQTPYVQTLITRKVLDKVTAALDGRISYGELRVLPSGVLLLKDAVIEDKAPYTEDINNRGWERADTLFSARTITATFSLSSLFGGNGIRINRVNIGDAMFHLAVEPGNRTNLERMFNLPQQTGRPEPGPEIFSIRKVSIRNFRFRLNNFCEAESTYPGYGLNYDDLDLTADINGHSLKFSGGRMYGVADKVTLTEKSGYRLLRASGRCIAGQGKTEIENFRLTDPWSKINVKLFTMSYDDPMAFQNFVSGVLMECELNRSEIGIPTLKYLAGILDGTNSAFHVRSCNFKGYVNDFAFSDFSFVEPESGVSGTISGNTVGLPDTGRMMAGLKIEGMKFTTGGLEKLLRGLLPGEELPDLSQYAPGVRFTLDAGVNGPMDRLKANVLLHSSAGGLQINADIRNLMSQSRGIEISSKLNTYGLQIDRMYPGLPFGGCTLEARAAATVDNGASRVRLDTLGISSISYNGIEYSGISASGSFIDNTLICSVESTDPSLKLAFDARAELGGQEKWSNYLVSGNIADIDLHKIGIDPREGRSMVGFSVDASISALAGNMEGHAKLGNIEVENLDGRIGVGDIDFRAYTQNGEQCFGLDSPFAAVSFSGTGSLMEFIDDIQDITLRRHLPAVYAAVDTSELKSTRYRMEAVFHDSRELMTFVMPGLYISDSTRLALSVSGTGTMDASLRSPRLAFGREYLKNVDMQVSSDSLGMEAVLSGTELRTGNILVSAPSLSASAADNTFGLALTFDSFAGGGKDGQLLVEGSIARDSCGLFTISAHPQNSYIATAEGVWMFNESEINYNGSELSVTGFNISKDEQMISIEGGYSAEKPDTLSLVAKDIDLSLIDEFLPDALGIRGKAGGRVLLTSGNGLLPGMLVNFRLDSLGIGGTDAGSIRIASALGEQREDISIIMRHIIGGRTAMSADGHYKLNNGSFDMTARLDSLPVSVAGPFLTDVFDDVDGGLSGEISLGKDSTGFSVAGKRLHIDDIRLGLAYTGVDYIISGPLELDNKGLYFENLAISDGADGKGTLSGAIRHDRLKNFELEAHTEIENLKAVDASEGGSSGIYGRLCVSGNASVSGPFNRLGVKAAIRTTGTGNIHVPASESLSSSTSDLLTFTEPSRPVDPYDEMLSDFDTRKNTGGDIDIQARLTAHPGITTYIELDKSEGSIASFSGEGSVNLRLRPSRAVFDINGDYIISEGRYTFSIPGILNRDFEIKEGSSAKFSGNIPDSELNIDAVYRLKTSLSSLISADSENSENSIGSTREVECGINISGRVRDPRLAFSINVPDLNPTVKSQVESALNTDDKVQKQFLALLLLGSFIPDEQSGVVNGSDILLSNVTELMSNQLNSILQKLDIPIDVGIGYQGAASGTNIFDVAISTQLFNNRVLVGGNFGSRRYGTSGTTNGDVVGDLDIQIKLDPEGKFRLNLFSHSADEYSNYLDYSQRNGVGISYQREYARLSDMWRSIFNPKKAREIRKAGSIPSPGGAGQNQQVIRIENEQGQTISDTDTTGRQ